MIFYSRSHLQEGLSTEQLPALNKVIRDTSVEIKFAPGSQPKLAINIDELSLLLRAARQTAQLQGTASKLYQAATSSLEELEATGVSDITLSLERAIDSYKSLE